ncbi:type II toxin-antitoxin system Phd/YefM family antitoxin [Photorhabdus luminescens]|uniref:Type II toxin-antitoxin system Phd/YefM family antitoxin n=1 Tax=Photorhabdus luminescens subsp. sonorensis TaxID=1173677 RepID=A0A5C4RNY7_PHOLU|nr:type II toxin-antitoxin system Phd/YefM family antitoxin [Photorhabdus luminescens]TNH45227.1 type II toxin-antitoxin system Phd/YefM family antitoxin [Photorhabdus luminescens subsp. sonorensis]
MAYQILTNTVASITDLKRNPMGIYLQGEGEAIAILNRNEPAFYCVPPELFAYYQERLTDECTSYGGILNDFLVNLISKKRLSVNADLVFYRII